jgi:hypothetical protein
MNTVPQMVERTLPPFVTQATTDILIRSLTESVSRTVVATVSEALQHPPEVVACCHRCKISGAPAACACCVATPADNAAVAVDLQERVTQHYATYYSGVAAAAFNANFTATLTGQGADGAGKKGA